MKNNAEGTLLPTFGNIQIKLNLQLPYERKFLFDDSEELNWLHGIKLLLGEKDKILFQDDLGLLIPVFLAKLSPQSEIFIVSASENKNLKSTLDRNKITNIKWLSSLPKLDDITLNFSHSLLSESKLVKSKNILLIPSLDQNYSGYKTLKNIDGRFFETNELAGLCCLKADFYLISKERVIDRREVNIIKKTKLSGATYLRSPEIYPFDLCYESVLDVVDEFIFGLDSVLQVNTDEERVKRKILIDSFMDNLEPAKRAKVQINEFDFKARLNKELSIPAKWLVDVSNTLLEKCQYENICFVQADEMYHEEGHKQILEFAAQDKYSALQHEFLHFMFDMAHIRNPETVAYTHAVRVFKKDMYSSTGDGYTFLSLKGKNHLPLEKFATHPIYHLGYVLDFRKKMEVHLADGGIFDFKDKKVNPDTWVHKADVVDFNGLLPKYLRLEGQVNSEKIKAYLK